MDERSRRRYRGLLVDYGGVMTTSVGRAFAEFCLREGIDPERMKDIIAEAYGGGTGSVMAQVERGEIAGEEFEHLMAGALSEGLERPIEPEGLKKRMDEGIAPEPRMMEAVAGFRRQGIRTALVSNSWGGSYPREGWDDLFDAVVVSGEVGLRKPQPEIFLHTAKLLEVEPTGCVFVDDLEQNAEAARAVGMIGIVHRSPEFTIPKLEDLFGVSLS